MTHKSEMTSFLVVNKRYYYYNLDETSAQSTHIPERSMLHTHLHTHVTYSFTDHISFISLQNGSDEAPLFDASILKQVDWDSRKANFRNGVSLTNPGENLVLRPLCLGDYDRGR